MRHAISAILLFTLGTACSPSKGRDGGDASDTPHCERTTPVELFSDTGTYTRELFVDRARGDDEAEGSRAHPWRTLSRAGQGREAGDRVHVLAGTYFECLRIENARGSATNPIAFVGEGEVRIHCMNGEALSGSGLAYVTIERFIVLSSSDGSNAIHIDEGSHHVVIRRNEVAGVGRAGDCVKVNASDDVWVLDNDLHNADTATGSAQGIDLVGVHRALVARNHVHDIRDSQGIFAKGGSSDVVIERNLIERLASEGGDAIGIVVGGVTDREFFSPPDAPYEATRVIARNNVVIGADGAGIGAQGCHQCAILGNTLWNCGRRGYAIQLSQGATGPRVASEVSFNVDIRVMNNLVGNPYGTQRAPIQAEPAQRQGLRLSHNWWWNGERDDVFDPGYNHEVGVDEPNSHLNEDPRVVGGTDASDLRGLYLAPDSPARRAGIALMDLNEDYEGRCRHAPPDIGALQTE